MASLAGALAGVLVGGVVVGVGVLLYAARPVAAAIQVEAAMVAPDGTESTGVPPNTPITYAPGSTREFSVSVPIGSDPGSVEVTMFAPDGSVYGAGSGVQHPWDVSTTGYTYDLSDSAALAPGIYTAYAIVSFQGGGEAQSDTVTFVQD